MTTSKAKLAQFSDLIHAKEEEWKLLQHQHIDSLSKELTEKDQQINILNDQFCQLKDDFKYNLKLLHDRDVELGDYEQVFQKLKSNEDLREGELSEMKIQLDVAETKHRCIQKELEDNQKHHQMRLKAVQEEANNFYLNKEKELKREKIEYEALKDRLMRDSRVSEDTKAFEQQKLQLQFEDSFKSREKELELLINKKDSELHSMQLKLQLLSKELEMLRESTKRSTEKYIHNDEIVRKQQQQLKERAWQIDDLTQMKAVEIKELEGKNEKILHTTKRKLSEFSRKYQDLEKRLNERERTLKNLKKATNENEQKLTKQLQLASKKHEMLSLRVKQNEWHCEEKVEVKKKAVFKANESISLLQTKLQLNEEALNKQMVARDLEIDSFRVAESLAKNQLKDCKGELFKAKKELVMALNRERILEDAKVQMEMDWRVKFERRENTLSDQNRQVSLALTGENNKLKILLSEKDIEIKRLSSDLLNADMIPVKPDMIPVKDTANTEQLANQNRQLKVIIREMRREMESLCNQEPSSPQPKTSRRPAGYVDSLEKEISSLKTHNRELHNQIEDLAQEIKPSNTHNATLVEQSFQTQLNDLNNTIGILRNDKVQLLAAVKSKDVTLNHLRNVIEKMEEGKRKQQLETETFKYDTSTQRKDHAQIVCTLQNRISDLELLVVQLQNEVEIYYKNGLQRNLDATNLSMKLSEMKMTSGVTASNIESEESSRLKWKLKLAVERLKEISIEKSKLVEENIELKKDLQHQKESVQLMEKAMSDNSTPLCSLVAIDEDAPQVAHFTGSQIDSGLTSPLSAQDDSSLKEIWEILEKEDMLSTTASNKSLAVVGKLVAPVADRVHKKLIVNRDIPVKTRSNKVRNYNVKDD